MEEVTVQCPYCFEVQTLEVEADEQGEMVQDCEVCCRPWQLVVSRDEEGRIQVVVERTQ